MQESMLKDYLITAQEHLQAKREIFNLKQERLKIAQEEYLHLNNAMTNLSSSKISGEYGLSQPQDRLPPPSVVIVIFCCYLTLMVPA